MAAEVISVDAAAEQARVAIEAGTRHVGFFGQPGMGKSYALALLAEASGRRVVQVAFPRRGDDVAFVGLTDLSEQLDHDGVLTEVVRNPDRRWEEKLARTLEALEASAALVVLDDPIAAGGTALEHSFFRERAAELTAGILQTPAITVAMGVAQPLMLPRSKWFHVRPASAPDDVLAQLPDEGGLRAAGARPMSRGDLAQLAVYSPLELRLAAWWTARHGDARMIHEKRLAPGVLVERAFEGRDLIELRRLLGALALCRTTFDATGRGPGAVRISSA